jgi:hypothetical protein
LSAGRISGTWLRDLTVEDLRITYGDSGAPIGGLTATSLAFEYELSRVITDDLLAAIRVVRGTELVVNLERLPERRFEGRRERNPGESVADGLSAIVSRTLPTPRLDLDGKLVLPHENAPVLGFDISGRLEDETAVRLDIDGESFAILVERPVGRLEFRTVGDGTTSQLALSGRVEARENAGRFVAASLRVEHGRTFADVEVTEREATVSMLVSAELLEGMRERWAEISERPPPVPVELTAGDTIAAGRLSLTGQEIGSVFSLLVAVPSSVMQHAAIRGSVEAKDWFYRDGPATRARATVEWDPQRQRLMVNSVRVDASSAAAFVVRDAELDFTMAFPVVALGGLEARVTDPAKLLGAAGVGVPASVPPVFVSASFREDRLSLKAAFSGEVGQRIAEARPIVLSLTETQLDFSFVLPAEIISGLGRSVLKDLGMPRVLPIAVEAGALRGAGTVQLSQGGPQPLYSILVADPAALIERATASVRVEASGWQYRGSPRADASLSASWNPATNGILVESLRVEALPLARVDLENVGVDIERKFPVTQLGRATLAISDARALLSYVDIEPVGVPLGFSVSAEATEKNVIVGLRDAHAPAGTEDVAEVSVEGAGELLQGVVDAGAFSFRSFPLGRGSVGDASGAFSGEFLLSEAMPVLDARVDLDRLRIVSGVGDSSTVRLENMRAELAVQGTPSVPEFDLSVGASGLRIGQTVLDVDGRFSQDEESLVIHRLRADGRSGMSLSADGRIPILVGARGVLPQNLRSASFSFLASAPSLHQLLHPGLHSMVPDGRADLQAKLEEGSGDLSVRAVVEAGGDEETPSGSPARGYPEITSTVRVIERDGNTLDTRVLVAIGDRQILEQVGEVRIPGLNSAQPEFSSPRLSISSRSHVSFPLSLAPSIVPAVIFGEGRIEATVVSQGPVNALVTEGRISVSDGGLRLAGSVPGINALNGLVTLSRDGLVAGEFSGELGRAPFLASGRYDFGVSGEPTLRAEVVGDNLLLVSEQDLRVRGNVAVAAAGTISDLAVSGELRITEARYTKDVPLLRFDSPPTVGDDTVQLPGVSGALARATTLDIAIRGDRSISVVNNVYQGDFSVDARLSGTLDVPVVTGRVFTDRGTVRLPVTDLNLTHVTITFPPEDPFSPRLQSQGSATIRNYDVFVRAFGAVPNIEVDIASSPSLPREQAILLLTTGQANVAGLESARQNVVTAGRVVGRRLSRLLFGPDSAAGDSAAGRVDIQVGQRLSQEGNPVIAVDFALASGESWFLEFERDEYDHYNLSLAWRFSFR